MARPIQLLLLQTVENLGIVGDIVKVKPGYARNYLLPLGLGEKPTPSKIEALKEQRAMAQSELEKLRGDRESLLGRMEDVHVTLIRSCNDQGVLYGSVTQRDISDAMQDNHFDVGTRSIRMQHSIRRIGTYAVPIQFDKDLRTEITVTVDPDQPLEERQEMEFDNEGNLIEPKARRPRRGDREGAAEGAAEGEPMPEPVVTTPGAPETRG